MDICYVAKCPRCGWIFITKSRTSIVCPNCGRRTSLRKAIRGGLILGRGATVADARRILERVNRGFIVSFRRPVRSPED